MFCLRILHSTKVDFRNLKKRIYGGEEEGGGSYKSEKLFFELVKFQFKDQRPVAPVDRKFEFKINNTGYKTFVFCIISGGKKLSIVLKFKFEVLYLSISVLCYFILLLHNISERNSVLFTALRSFKSSIYFTN